MTVNTSAAKVTISMKNSVLIVSPLEMGVSTKNREEIVCGLANLEIEPSNEHEREAAVAVLAVARIQEGGNERGYGDGGLGPG
jgi:hypothetical protein